MSVRHASAFAIAHAGFRFTGGKLRAAASKMDNIVETKRRTDSLLDKLAAGAAGALGTAFKVGVKMTQAAQGVLEYTFATDCHLSPLLSAFTRWDGAHFLNVAQHGWQSEWSHAFFPMYPLMM